jgi:hypothetical protein
MEIKTYLEAFLLVGKRVIRRSAPKPYGSCSRATSTRQFQLSLNGRVSRPKVKVEATCDVRMTGQQPEEVAPGETRRAVRECSCWLRIFDLSALETGESVPDDTQR